MTVGKESMKPRVKLVTQTHNYLRPACPTSSGGRGGGGGGGKRGGTYKRGTTEADPE